MFRGANRQWSNNEQSGGRAIQTGGAGGGGYGRRNGVQTSRRTGGGCGFGFRGATPPAPYTGRGRGGLPRCQYYLQNNRNNAGAATQNDTGKS